MKELMPMMKNYRDILKEVGRLMAPSGLKSPGATFRFEGMVANQGATGGQWFKVVRNAPREPMMTFFFGSAPRRDGEGIRAIAPDRSSSTATRARNYRATSTAWRAGPATAATRSARRSATRS